MCRVQSPPQLSTGAGTGAGYATASAPRWVALRLPNWGRTLVLVLLCVVLTAPAARAQDGLYGEAAPDDAAFVRLVNASERDDLGSVWIAATEFSGLDPYTVSPYRPIFPGIHRLSIGGHETELIPDRGEYYTVVLTADELVVVEDIEHTRPDRAQLVLYNFSPWDGLELRTAAGDATAVEAVPRGRGRAAEVNPIEIAFAVYHGGELLEAVGDPGLERGQSYGVFVLGGEPSGRADRADRADRDDRGEPSGRADRDDHNDRAEVRVLVVQAELVVE